jgi:hypothetical protein
MRLVEEVYVYVNFVTNANKNEFLHLSGNAKNRIFI